MAFGGAYAFARKPMKRSGGDSRRRGRPMAHEPHLELVALYTKRRELREACHSQMTVAANRRAVMDLELTIHEAHKRIGRAVFQVRRCEVCLKMHAAATDGCDQRGEHLFSIWCRLGVDTVHVVE
jgi:hypothetical protein